MLLESWKGRSLRPAPSLLTPREPNQFRLCSLQHELEFVARSPFAELGKSAEWAQLGALWNRGQRMSSRLCAVSCSPDASDAGVELILPCQYHDLSGGHHLTGEQRLALALLTDAINVYQKGALSRVSRVRRLYVDAETWIMADRVQPTILGFSAVCDALGINSTLLRRRLVEWKHQVSRQCNGRQSSATHFKINRREHHLTNRRGRPPAQAFQST